MRKKLIFDYANECVVELGTLVGKMRAKGLEIGLTEAETRKVWLTCFDVLESKHRISRELMSQNLRRKATSPEVA